MTPKEENRVVKAAIGSFLGFLMSMGIRLIWCVLLAWWFVRGLL